MKTAPFKYLVVFSIGILLSATLFVVFSHQGDQSPKPTSEPVAPPRATAVATETKVLPILVNRTILLDDFGPQPYQGESVYPFNRIAGDRGALNESILDWGNGEVATTISPGHSWGGLWISLNHPIREGLPIDFSAILPPQVLSTYQSKITGITVRIGRGTPKRTFKIELKDGSTLRWKKEIVLNGGSQVANFDLPALGRINHFVWVLDHASAGDYVVVESVSFTTATPITDTATAAFVWSYGMLLNNWNPATGLVRDKAKDASGEFDAIQATGSLAATTAVAEQLGIVTHADAAQIVGKIENTLLLDLPRFRGLWPHWVKVSPAGEIAIAPNTEWSSVDTVIAAIGLLAAQGGLGMDTSGTEQMLQSIDWIDLVTPGGISHGYTHTGDVIPYAWDVFGGESWLVELVYAGVNGQVAPITYPSPATANGSGFIDELAWLFVSPPSRLDYWGTDWTAYRLAAADSQIDYYPTQNPTPCVAKLGLFGLSAAEVPDPSSVPPASIYQAFGVGGRFASANDGAALLGGPVIVPHYAAMIALLHPQEAIEMWEWLIDEGYFSPLNNAESLLMPSSLSCESAALSWNQLKGSWNLSLQTLGWGRYLAERDGHVPILWQATMTNPLLRRGYLLLVPGGPSPNPNLSRPAGKVSYEVIDWEGKGLEGKSISSLAIDPATPTTLYAGTGSGVLKTTDGGGNWRAANTGLTNTTVFALAIDPVTPTTLYAGTGNGVFKTTNGGEDWHWANSGIPKAITGLTNPTAYPDVYALAIDPKTPTTLYAGTVPFVYTGSWRNLTGGIFKSTNGGENWRIVARGNSAFRSLVVDPMTPDTLYAGKTGGVLKSTNGSQDWSTINSGLTCAVVNALAIAPETPTTLYAGTSCGLLKSTNGGGNWSAANTALTKTNILALAIDPNTATTLYVVTNRGVLKRTEK